MNLAQNVKLHLGLIQQPLSSTIHLLTSFATPKTFLTLLHFSNAKCWWTSLSLVSHRRSHCSMLQILGRKRNCASLPRSSAEKPNQLHTFPGRRKFLSVDGLLDDLLLPHLHVRLFTLEIVRNHVFAANPSPGTVNFFLCPTVRHLNFPIAVLILPGSLMDARPTLTAAGHQEHSTAPPLTWNTPIELTWSKTTLTKNRSTTPWWICRTPPQINAVQILKNDWPQLFRFNIRSCRKLFLHNINENLLHSRGNTWPHQRQHSSSGVLPPEFVITVNVTPISLVVHTRHSSNGIPSLHTNCHHQTRNSMSPMRDSKKPAALGSMSSTIWTDLFILCTFQHLPQTVSFNISSPRSRHTRLQWIFFKKSHCTLTSSNNFSSHSLPKRLSHSLNNITLLENM